LSRENENAIPPQANIRNKSMSGSGGGGGYEYQARAAAYVAAHILAQEHLGWIEHENPDVPVAVAEETDGAGDDLCITLHDGVQIELQAKHGLQKDKLWEPLIKLGQGLQENPQLYGVLLIDTTASKIIREDLRNNLIRLGQGRTDKLKPITQEARQKFVKANLPESDTDFFRRLRIIVLDLDDGLQDGKHAQLLLSKVLHDPTQSANVWKILWGEGLKLISHAGYRDSKDWARLLSHQGIQLASTCSKANGVMSPEEKKYLESVSKKFEAWWKPHAFIDEIDESTWFEFVLNTKVPKSKDEDNSSKNNNDSDKEITVPILDVLSQLSNERILIVGKPGAGKSTLLHQILLRSAKKALEDSNAPIPVLIKLNCYTQQPNILNLIRVSFERHEFLLGILEPEKLIYIENLIKDKRLLLLVDGVNGLSREARSALKDFCDHDLPIILTTREVDAGNLGIRKKLEIQPLKSDKVKEFFNKNLPNHQDRVKELCDRVSDFGQTPLMVWMLYSIFRQNPQSEISPTRGEAYRKFTTIYIERGQNSIDLGDSISQLSKIAFEMTCSEGPIYESQARRLIGTSQFLEQLLGKHLIEWNGLEGSRKVEFCHPSLQEYFTAEYLSSQLTELIKNQPDQDYTKFQITYLNHLKWTEAISLMLGFPETSDNLTIGIVKQALQVDLNLSTKLVKASRSKYSSSITDFLDNLDVSGLVRYWLFGTAGIRIKIPQLMHLVNSKDLEISNTAATALMKITIDLDNTFELDSDKEIHEFLVEKGFIKVLNFDKTNNSRSMLIKDVLEAHKKIEQSMSTLEKLYYFTTGPIVAELIGNLWDKSNFFTILIVLTDLFDAWNHPFSTEHVRECLGFLERMKEETENNREKKLAAFIEKDKKIKNTLATIFKLSELHTSKKIDFQDAILIFIVAINSKISDIFRQDNKYLNEITSIEFFKRLIETGDEKFIRDLSEIIFSVQSRCGFYNYDIAQSTPQAIPIEIQQEGKQSNSGIQTIKIFEHVENYIENNYQNS
jgi:NACHT domain